MVQNRATRRDDKESKESIDSIIKITAKKFNANGDFGTASAKYKGKNLEL